MARGLNIFGKGKKKAKKKAAPKNAPTVVPVSTQQQNPLTRIGLKAATGAGVGTAMVVALPLGRSPAGLMIAGGLGKLVQMIGAGIVRSMSNRPHQVNQQQQVATQVAQSSKSNQHQEEQLDSLITLNEHIFRCLYNINITLVGIARKMKTAQYWRAQFSKEERARLARMQMGVNQRHAARTAPQPQGTHGAAQTRANIPGIVAGAGIAAMIAAIAEMIGGKVKQWVEGISSILTVYRKKIITALEAAWDGFKGLSFVKTMKNWAPIKGLISFFETVGDLLKPFEPMLTAVMKTGGALIKRILWPVTVIMGLADTVKGAMEGYDKAGIGGAILGGIGGLFNSIIGSVLDLLKDTASWMLEKLGFDDVSKWLDSFNIEKVLADTIFDLTWWKETVVDWVSDMMKKITKFIEDAWDATKKGITDWGTRVANMVKKDVPKSIQHPVETIVNKGKSLYNDTVSMLESSGGKNTKAATSTAQGNHQFTEATWLEMMGKYGAQYGYNMKTRQQQLDLRNDPLASERMNEALAAENKARLMNKLGTTDVSDSDLYKAHFLGAEGAFKLLKGAKDDPNALAKDVFPAAAKANSAIFYDKERPRTISEVNDLLSSRYSAAEARVAKASTPDVAPKAGNELQIAAAINDASMQKNAGSGSGGVIIAPNSNQTVNNATVIQVPSLSPFNWDQGAAYWNSMMRNTVPAI